MNIYALRDRKLGQVVSIQSGVNHLVYFRYLDDYLHRAPEGDMMKDHPGDFEVLCVGEFNRDTGQVFAEGPQFLITLDQLSSMGESDGSRA